MTIKALLKYVLFMAGLILCSGETMDAQYLRDKTRLIDIENFSCRNHASVLGSYLPEEKYELSLDKVFEIPEVLVDFGEKSFPLLFDFGNSGNITITNALADLVDYTVTDTSYTYTPDGRIRGETYRINVPFFRVLDTIICQEEGDLMDWSVTSTEPYYGLIGLKYIGNKCFTLSYKEKQLAVSERSVVSPEDADCIKVPLETYAMHPYGLHLKGKVNGTDAIIYLDTGKSVSIVSRDLVPEERILSDKSGSFFDGTVSVNIGGKIFRIFYPRVRNIQRNIESDLPVGIEIGSDILRYMLLSVDRTDGMNMLIIHR